MHPPPPVLKPRRLRRGDTIGVIAPASPPATPESVENGIRYLEREGFRIRLGDAIEEKHGYLAGPDADRVKDIHRMFADPEVHAIISIRGGYGCGRLLPMIDFDLIRRNPKILIGYSDLTALQLALFKRTGLITFAGPMLAADFGNEIDTESADHFWSMLMEAQPEIKLSFGEKIHPFNNDRAFSGPLLGGNLSLLCSLIGSDFLPGFNGAVLAMEEIGEPPYRIDRMLNQLKLHGMLDTLSGILLGQFSDCEPKDDRPSLTLLDVFGDYLNPVAYPVIGSMPFGHEKKKVTLPLGALVRYEPADRSVKVIDSPVL
jgi:muramoyltetrapeptide carboxypeptidase